jgi:hypothetical protein
MVVIDYPELYKYKPVLYQINTFKYILKIKYPHFVMAEEVPLNGQKEDNDFINLKNESECDGRLHGFIYLYG